MGSFALQPQQDAPSFARLGVSESDTAKPKPAPARPAPKPVSTGPANPADALADAIRAISAGANSAELAERLAELAGRVQVLESRKPEQVQYTIGAVTGKPVANARPELAELVEHVAMGFVNLWLTGPAGSGKTTLARSIAEALGRPFGFQSFGPDVNSGAIIGGVNVRGKFNEAAFIDAYENGHVYLLDEIDAADPSILLTINAALDNGIIALTRHHDPARRIIKRHADTIIVCAANTWGTGADAQYIGRTQLDAAFLDRFVLAMFAIGYDKDLERRLCPDAALLAQLWDIRSKVMTHKIRRVISTRAIIGAAKMRAGGAAQSKIIARLMASWTEAEKAKVMS